VNNGNGGNSYVNLRGLGSNRNIVLLDGNRLVPADLAGRVDLNDIPLALVSRVDSLTGAAVTTYGADAITGVVNFVTKKNFAGVDLSVGEAINQKGDGNTARVDLTIGGNFDEGKGNAVLSIGYQKSDPVYQGDRDFAFNQISSFTGGLGGSPTSVPSRFSGTRPIDPATGQPSVNPAVLNGGVRQINPATGQAVTTFALFNFNPYNLFQTPFKRYNAYASANYQVSDSIEVYTRAIYSNNTVNTILAPAGAFGTTVAINLNNPFLPAALRNQFCAFNIAPLPVGGAAPTYTPRFTPAQCAAAATATGPSDPNYRTVTATLSRRSVEAGPRITDYNTQVFDLRAGVRGAINSHINWDVNGSYGQSQQIQTIGGYLRSSLIKQALLVNGTAAAPVCNDPSNGCVPINVFGPLGSLSPAAVSFLQANSTILTKTTLAQFRALINGDLGFTSPAGTNPVSFALGTEYRKYTAQQVADNLSQTPGELSGTSGSTPNINGTYDVWEGFGELVAPLVEDKPLFKSLTAEGGVRYSRYTVAGAATKQSATTYKAGLSWEPVSGLKFRGNYAHAVRAPNIGELFTPVTTQLTNLGVDPCAGAAPLNNATLRAVCIAQGAPAGTIGSIISAAQPNATTGGNINLKPEIANTYTAGVVFQPSMVRGLSLSVDYYRIRVTSTIGSLTPGDAIKACFGSLGAASATDPNCTLIRRNPLTGGLDGDASTTPGLFLATNNLGILYTNGIDANLNFVHQFNKVKYSLNVVGNYTFHAKFKASPGSIDRECVGFYSVNCASLQPKYQWSVRNTFTYGKVDLSLLWRHIDKMRYEPQQALDDGQGLFVGTAPANVGSISGKAVDFNRIAAANYFDLTARFDVSDNFNMTVGVANLFDKQPPIIGTNGGATAYDSGNTYPSTYDALGRRFSVSAHVKF
jgi:iron complex outermembrane receptor protein